MQQKEKTAKTNEKAIKTSKRISNETNKNIKCNIKKYLLQHSKHIYYNIRGESAVTLRKSYYNISSTTNAIITSVATKKSIATSGENLLQQ